LPVFDSREKNMELPRVMMLALAFLFLPSAWAAAAPGDAGTVVWDISERGFFDREGAMRGENGRVVVELDGPAARVPRVLGIVREAALRYRVAAAGDYWFHLAWDPGDSGKEQFELLFNGQKIGTSTLVDAATFFDQEIRQSIPLVHRAGSNEITLRFLSGDGLNLRQLVLSASPTPPRPLKPDLKFPTLASYAAEIKEPAILLDSDNVRMYAPKTKEREANIVFPYLVKAYAEYYRLVGVHTAYKMVVYHFPAGNPNWIGGTSECTIWYGYRNLELDSQEEWIRHQVPHVAGYIEEMGHNFVSASMTTFGWEMVGWMISTEVTATVAGNPVVEKGLQLSHSLQDETYRRYRQDNNTFPKDIEANLVDRIHAYILWKCELAYGANFWPDFFKEMNRRRPELLAASRATGGDELRNAWYRIAVDCLDHQMKGQFKGMLKDAGVSLTTDIKSLHPMDKGWNRKLE
jgi:hypothetical protein